MVRGAFGLAGCGKGGRALTVVIVVVAGVMFWCGSALGLLKLSL